MCNLSWMSQASNAVKSNAKTYTIVTPNGQEVTFTNLSDYCRRHKLSIGSLHQVLSGKRPHHKGWTRL